MNLNLFRNPEVRRELIWHAAVTAALAIAAAFISYRAVILAVIAGVLFFVVHFVPLARRYKAIAELSSTIDRILHGNEELLFSDSSEGELAILRSEIQKMTVRLRDQADMLKSDKLRLTSAIADISHQLRTPLTSMNLTVSMLSADDLDEDRRADLVRELGRSLRRVDWLIEALLKMSKIDAGTAQFAAESVSVKSLIDKATAPFIIPMELKDITLRVTVADETFTGDIAWSAEALGNIVKNCMEHTPAGGFVDISARETALFTEITIRDSGEGFSPEDIPNLFRRFYRGKNAAAGSVGIGLALARSVISAQNGTVTAANAAGGGALFTIKFYKGIV